MKKISVKRLFENNRFVQIFSIVMAALCWLLVAMTQSYETTETIYHVPVKIDSQSAALTSVGLHAIESDAIFVDVEVEGIRSVVGGLTPADFSLTARLAGVTEKGVYELLPVSAAQTPSQDYTIKSFTPKTVKVKFDRVERLPFPIGEQVNGLSIAPGFIEKNTLVTPDTINIEGPSTSLEKIARCAITAELTSPLDRTYAGEFPIILYDANGDVLNPDDLNVNMDRTEAQLIIRVLKTTTLPLKIDFTNLPRGFPEDELLARTNISANDVDIAGPAELIDKTSEIRLDPISIKQIKLGSSTFAFDVNLPSPSDQFIRIDNITTVAVSIDEAGLATANFNVKAPQLINMPVGFDVELLAKIIPNVQFVGKKEIIESMTADDIVAEIDLSDRDIISGSYPFPVKISVPGKGLVWAVGDHNINIQVTEKTDS